MKIKTFDERLKLGNGDYNRLVNSRKPKGIEKICLYYRNRSCWTINSWFFS